MIRVAAEPGLVFDAMRPAAEPSPLRTDVAGFIGRTRRGPLGVAVRVTGWREFRQIFGGALADADTPLALQGYFDNGGDVAWIVRLPTPQTAKMAEVEWDLACAAPGELPWQGWNPADARFTAPRYRVKASSLGAWGSGVRVGARYRSWGAGGLAEVDLSVRAADEPEELLVGLDPKQIESQVAARSALVRLVPLDSFPAPQVVLDRQPSPGGPQLLRWQPLVLAGGGEDAPVAADYFAAIALLGDHGEVALTAMPDLQRDVGGEAEAVQIEAMAQAEALHDRLVVLDLPVTADAVAALAWSRRMRDPPGSRTARAGVAYHPPISVADPFGGVARPLRTIPPCGHVAGLISRLDRERGAQHTPANATLSDVVDVAAGFAPAERAALNEAGINVLRCKPGQGIQVWGGRTLLDLPEGRYVAHRRLIHRLVRAVRRVAEPLVFETNGPTLWLALARAATSVLLEAWRAGGLQGERADEAFRVSCDEANNPPEQQALGITVCEIQLAPAVPMEFITLRVSLSAQGSLDVFEQ